MIRYFNFNKPILTVFLFGYACLLNLVLFISPSEFSLPVTHAPFSKLVYFIMDFLFNNNHYLLSFLSIVLVWLQALMLNQIMNEIKVFEKATFVPALIYISLACLFREYLYFTPVLFANTFIILVIGKALEFFRKQRCFMDIYDMGLLIAISSLFYYPAFLLVLLMFIALGIFRAFSWKEWMAGFSGFFTAYFLTGTCYFMMDRFPEFMQNHIFSGTISIQNGMGSDFGFHIVTWFTVALAIAASILFGLNYLKSQIHIRKFFMLCGWAFLLLFISGLFKPEFSLNHFALLSVPLSVAISYLFMNTWKPWVADLLHGIWILSVLIFQYF